MIIDRKVLKMIFISTALYYEAKPFIKKLQLKKDVEEDKYQLFKNEEITLVISGVGMITSACCVTYILTKYGYNENDHFINIGIAGCKNSMYDCTICLINKIIDITTNKTFYPDILYKHSFIEKTITTVPISINASNDLDMVYDMESSAIYQAAIKYLHQHQIHFIKIISDQLKPNIVTKELILNIIQNSCEPILNYINNILENNNLLLKKDLLSKSEQKIIQLIINNLNFTKTMSIEFVKYIRYFKLINSNIDILNKYKNIKVANKNEGKKYYNEILQQLFMDKF